jgi:signal transduction histidine kinase
VTRVEDRGQPLAVLVHDTVVLDDPGLVDGVAAVAQLAVTNARLRAEVRARVTELAASRRRIVEAGDAQRSQLEQALATGAERRLAEVDRLLTELAPTSAQLTGLAEVCAEVQEARTDLHAFAQGVRPTALGEGGLPAALPVLAARSGVPVTLTVSVGRLPPAVESALYFVCSEALANVGKHAGATSVTVVVRRADEDGDVTLTVEDDGVGGADPRGSGLRGLADRVEALGGAMMVADGPAGGTVLSARIPAQTGGRS